MRRTRRISEGDERVGGRGGGGGGEEWKREEDGEEKINGEESKERWIDEREGRNMKRR